MRFGLSVCEIRSGERWYGIRKKGAIIFVLRNTYMKFGDWVAQCWSYMHKYYLHSVLLLSWESNRWLSLEIIWVAVEHRHTMTNCSTLEQILFGELIPFIRYLCKYVFSGPEGFAIPTTKLLYEFYSLTRVPCEVD